MKKGRKKRRKGRKGHSQSYSVNNEHKASVFHLLFGTEENKANALELYNAINGTAYSLEDLEITTLETVIYMGVKNDASLIVGSEMSLWEHQSSFNPNMPLRGLVYFGRLYDGWVERKDLNIYGRKKLTIPAPRYYVFYNGKENQPESIQLRLSDLYEGEGDVEVTATMLNINEGHNLEIMERCKPLRDYARLIGLIRQYSESMDIEEAVDKAVEQCIKEGVMEAFLRGHRAEVRGMMLTDYDEKKTLEHFKKEWYEDGWNDGEMAGCCKGCAMFDEKHDSCADIPDFDRIYS